MTRPILSTRLLTTVVTALYRPVMRRAARQILEGRYLDPREPRAGRWSRDDVDAFLEGIWERVPRLARRAQLDELPSIGNRHNVLLAVMTTAAYRSMLEAGQPRERAAELVGDVGWKVYRWMLRAAAAPFRLVSSNRQETLEWTLKALMVFPFDAPGAPGYEVETWSDEDGFHTHWTHCPPQTFVRRLIEEDGDRGELDAFYRSWCLYDWAGADELVDDGAHGHYERAHTLSRGDSICDMCWHAEACTAAVPREENRPARSAAPAATVQNPGV